MKYNFRFSLKLKIMLAFLVLGGLILLMYMGLNRTQKTIRDTVADDIDRGYPAMVCAEALKDIIMESQYIITQYTLKAAPRESKLTEAFASIKGERYDNIKSQLNNNIKMEEWNTEGYNLLFELYSVTDSLFSLQEDLMEELDNAEKFNDITGFSYKKYSVVDGEIYTCYKRALMKASRLAGMLQKAQEESLLSIDNGFQDSDKTLIYSILGCVAFVIIIMLMINHAISRLNNVKDRIKEMADGSLPEIAESGSDEIGEISHTLKTLVSNLKETSQFAIKIGEGDFASEFHPQSKRDVLANSLLVMRDNLIKADKEAEQRKEENSQRNWQAQGLAEFNEVLRNAGDDMQVLSNRVVERLVRYLDANMGGIYILDDSNPDDTHLELTAFYAYDRLKYVKQRIEIGENLVGQCFRENETVFMTDIPKGYVHISSGLGEADPTCLVIVPLKVNGETYGIVELASFQLIEKYQVEFIEKIGETIASTIANVKINMNTQRLLEESNQKTERLAQQESEVHKIIEGLKSKIENLEDANKRETVRYQKLHDDFENQAETNQSVIQKLNEKNDQLKDELIMNQFVMNNSMGYYELDAQGFFMMMNPRMLHVIDMPFVELENHDVRSFMTQDADIKAFNDSMRRLSDGLIHSAITRYSFNGKEFYLSETFSPVRDEYNVLLKICVVAKDMTSEYQRISDLENRVTALIGDK